MILSPGNYAARLENYSLEELIAERNRLICALQVYECRDPSDQVFCICPSPDVVYKVSNMYLLEVTRLINERFNPSTAHNFIIRHPCKDENQVDAWSTQSIPFEPKDWRRDMRDELKQALSNIVPNDDCLYAAFICNDTCASDVENVLFYNIGAPAFYRLSKNGLCFEGRFDSNPFTFPLGRELGNYYHYAMQNEFSLWREKDILSAWKEVPIPTPTRASRPHLFWYALKKAKNSAFCEHPVPKRFGVSIQLHIPELAWCNLAILIKPLLDGIISAFHMQNAPRDKILFERLSKLTDCTAAEVEHFLYESKTVVLGKRPVVSTYRESVKWNPQDDACVACRVIIDRDEKYRNWSISGKLFSVQVQ